MFEVGQLVKVVWLGLEIVATAEVVQREENCLHLIFLKHGYVKEGQPRVFRCRDGTWVSPVGAEVQIYDE